MSHYIPTTWKNKMIKQYFNYADSTIKEMTDFFETRVENLVPKEDKKNLQQLPRNPRNNSRNAPWKKREDSDSSVVESREKCTEARRPSKKYCILHNKCRHSMDSCKDQRTMVNKHKQKKNKNFRTYLKSNKELNALIQKKFQKFVKNKKRSKTYKELQHFQKMHITDNESKKSVSSLAESVENGEILSFSSEWKMGWDELFVTCLNRDNDNKKGKLIKNYLDRFINTSLNHISIRSCLVSQPNNKSINLK